MKDICSLFFFQFTITNILIKQSTNIWRCKCSCPTSFIFIIYAHKRAFCLVINRFFYCSILNLLIVKCCVNIFYRMDIPWVFWVYIKTRMIQIRLVEEVLHWATFIININNLIDALKIQSSVYDSLEIKSKQNEQPELKSKPY